MAMDAAENEVEKVIRQLTSVADRLRQQQDWQNLDVPGRIPEQKMSGEAVGAFKATPSLDEITVLIELYWATCNEVENAWEALPEDVRNSGSRRPPPTVEVGLT
jgi:hypothetical protein